jgi:hypothetical protein
MVQFSLMVKAGDRLREFNFRKLKTPHEEFSVNVCDERGNRIFFQMLKNDSNWKISSTQLPTWISQTETRLNDAVEDELRNW